MRLRIVVDTNVHVSRFLRPRSLPGLAVEKVWSEATSLVSSATLLELRSVLLRDKFAKYIQRHTISPYVEQVEAVAETIAVSSIIQACRHPQDDKFLELAVDGRADLIVTGDQDLLVLHPFRGITILTPAEFLAQ